MTSNNELELNDNSKNLSYSPSHEENNQLKETEFSESINEQLDALADLLIDHYLKHTNDKK
jgi:hypothetical protein